MVIELYIHENIAKGLIKYEAYLEFNVLWWTLRRRFIHSNANYEDATYSIRIIRLV